MSDEPIREKADAAVPAPAPNEGPPEPPEQKVAAAPPVVKPEVERSTLLSRLLQVLFSISVRYKIAGTLIVILSLAVISLGVVTFTQQNAIPAP